MIEAVTIAKRFCGPPTSGNGGYVCGALARHIDGPAQVTLKAPPPLETTLEITASAEGAVLSDGDTELAVAVPATPQASPPAPPSFEAAERAARDYVGFRVHEYPSCFVCGPDRAPKDGLCIFPGAMENSEFIAAPWTPDASLEGDAGMVSTEFVWAALDCPSYFGLRLEGVKALLGRLTAEIIRLPRIGEKCVILGWGQGEEGRKCFGATAVYGEDGAWLGRADAVWIRLQS